MDYAGYAECTLALGHWGFVWFAHAPPVQIKRYAHNVDYPPHTHLPAVAACKTTAPQRLVTVADYAPPLSPLIHQLSPGAAKSPAPRRLLLLEVLHARCRTTGRKLPDRIIMPRYGSGVTGVGDLIRAICCVSRYHAGCTANGIAKPSHEHGPLRPSIFSARLRKRNLKMPFVLNCPCKVAIW